jgi:hypothetical protein
VGLQTTASRGGARPGERWEGTKGLELGKEKGFGLCGGVGGSTGGMLGGGGSGNSLRYQAQRRQ